MDRRFVLIVRCANLSGGWHESILELRHCVHNVNGKLKWKRRDEEQSGGACAAVDAEASD